MQVNPRLLNPEGARCQAAKCQVFEPHYTSILPLPLISPTTRIPFPTSQVPRAVRQTVLNRLVVRELGGAAAASALPGVRAAALQAVNQGRRAACVTAAVAAELELYRRSNSKAVCASGKLSRHIPYIGRRPFPRRAFCSRWSVLRYICAGSIRKP